MPLCMRHLAGIARTPIHRTQWRRIPHRYYSSTSSSSIQSPLATFNAPAEPEWFQNIRNEMLNRELPVLHDVIDEISETKLANTLSAFFPPEWSPILTSMKPVLGKPPGSVGNHLIFFNPSLPADQLLEDGTDPLQSPGGPFVRRMWAGGSLRVNMGVYSNKKSGWERGAGYMCAERIKDVQLRGQDDAAKIFVTIERRFAKTSRLMKAVRETEFGKKLGVGRFFQKQVMEQEGWGDAQLIEERNLVFMRERNAAELEDIQAGRITPTKYLKAPGKPDFSHTLTPTSSLLFRFSALTFNAHAIHLDRTYCRTIEGHRDLLVHGPLSLLLMIKLISAHLYAQDGNPQVIQSIEYRNLAPLYCDEELRLCAREKTSLKTKDGRTYDVWVEGPTGGMAVRGTVRTAEYAG